MLSINTNLSSIIAQNSMNSATAKLNQAIERMTTGAKINHAKDNAAGYSIATNMTTKMNSYMVAQDNAEMGMDMIVTASEGLSSMKDYATRLRALSIQAQNGTFGTQSLNAIKTEAKSITKEIERLYNTTKYNGVELFNRTEYDIPDYLPKAGKSGFIDESTLSEYALRREEDDLFIDNPVTYTDAEVQAMTSIDEFDLSKSKKYKITSAKDLAKLADIVNSGTTCQNAIFVLSEDIDLKDWCDKNGNWIPIGIDSTSHATGFRGTFDGNGHTISNLKIDEPTKDHQGLFGHSGQYSTIKNIALVNVEVSGKSFVGGLVGQQRYGTIQNCHASGKVTGSGSNVGGMIGSGGATYCNADVEVSGSGDYYGGLVGKGQVTNSYATGDVTANGSYVGGLCGQTSSITNCYATGNVTCTTGSYIGGLIGVGHAKNSYAIGNVNSNGSSVGGLIGEQWGGTGLIENCFSTGNVYGKSTNIGGLIGNNKASVKNCYSLSKVEGNGKTGGLIGWHQVNNDQYVTGCFSAGEVINYAGYYTDNNSGGLIGHISYASTAQGLSLENNKTYSTVTGGSRVGSFIGCVSITRDGTTYETLNISNCEDKSQAMEKIGSFNTSYDATALLAEISDVSIKDTNINLQVGINNNDSSRITFSPKLDLEFDFSTIAKNIDSKESLKQIDDFIDLISAKETELGAVTNRLESVLDEIEIQYSNLASSRSTIRDADIAEVSSEYIKMQILQQASSTLLATANQTPSIALQLI